MTVKRLNYATGQFLTSADFQLEQEYHRKLRRLHNQCLHTPGVAGGLLVTKKDDSHVTISAGMAIDANGAEIALLDPLTLDLSTVATKEWVALTAAYKEADLDEDKGKIGKADAWFRRSEFADVQLVQVTSLVALPALDGIAIRLAVLHMTGGKLAEIIVTPSARQVASSKLDPAAAMTTGDLRVNGTATVQGATTLAGAARAAGPVQFDDKTTFTGAAQFNSDAKITGTVTVGGGLAVTGGTTVGNLTSVGSTTSYGSVFCGNSDAYFMNPTHNYGAVSEQRGAAAIENAADYNALMILGRTIRTAAEQGGISRVVKLWDYLEVNGSMRVFSPSGQAYGLMQVGVSPPLPRGEGSEIGAMTVYGMTVLHGDLKVYGAKTGYVVDQFVNQVGDGLELGDVVVVEQTQPAFHYGVGDNIPVPEVDLARQAYDTRVCGIVCRVDGEMVEAEPAKGKGRSATRMSAKTRAVTKLRPRMFEHADKENLDATKVAPGQIGSMVTLGAFAHCKVDADIAPIVAGDLLTTSATPGHAQKVLDRTQAVGAIIGKALAPLKKGKGRIPILVMLQ